MTLSVWYKGHSDREKRTKQLQGYRRAFTELREILEQEYKKKPAVRDYSPGWEYKQVAVNEYNQVLDDLYKLLEIDKE